jgi:hypothetical protein
VIHHTSDPSCPLCEEKLKTAHPDLVAWFKAAVKPKHPDAHVSWAYRDQAAQEAAFEDGKTNLHFPQSAHNKIPARALDLFEIVQGQALWPPLFFAAISATNKLDYPNIIWGGTFKTLGDGDHFELLPDVE